MRITCILKSISVFKKKKKEKRTIILNLRRILKEQFGIANVQFDARPPMRTLRLEFSQCQLNPESRMT